jgi:DNA polymerase I-like protein with 3'-5' exonuclease and polymerase domains
MNTTTLGQQTYRWDFWDGQQLGKHVAIDTETTLITGHTIPQLCMGSISDGHRHFILHPDRIAAFMLMHLPQGSQLIAHNAAFDFWVLDKHLAGSGADDARSWLWATVDQGKLHDTMLLHALITLALSDDDTMSSLADLASKLLGIQLDKDSYRTRYSETLGQDWQQLDVGFFQYAVADAIVTWQLFCKLTHQASSICQQHNLNRSYGFLTERLQVQASISLAGITRQGMHVDLARAAHLQQQIDADIQQAVATMQQIDQGLWHTYVKTGLFKTNKESGLPKMNQNRLLEHLQRIANEHQLKVPTTATGQISSSVNECWTQYTELHPLVAAYCTYTELTKLRTFFTALDKPTIHPKYRTLVRSGRTSCSGPNIQQLPARSPIRNAITARPGNLLFIIDYNALELRTLAAVCYERIGFSRLRDVLIDGTDPHSYAAAMFAGLELEAFEQLPNKKQLRQQAKVFNFGLPAGFGAAALVDHAKFAYGVTLTQDDAERFIDLLTRQVYPELQLYLSEDTATILAQTLQADVVQVRAAWPQPYHMGLLRRLLAGHKCKRDGTPYQPQTIDRAWQQLESLCQNQHLLPYIQRGDVSSSSPLRRLFNSAVSTTTGRMRGGVPFTAARNAPFQGLAADGCKAAMWNLTKAGYRIVAFIHDEFIIELSKLDDIDQAAAEIKAICQQSMQPFIPGIPVPVEYALTYRWDKAAVEVRDEQGQLLEWHPV